MSLNELMASALDPDKCEGTAYPYWFVFDPQGMAGRCMSYRDAVSTACMSIHGPFFSREAATAYRDSQRHNLSGHEVVWCGSAHMSRDYRTLLDLAKAPGWIDRIRRERNEAITLAVDSINTQLQEHGIDMQFDPAAFTQQ